jgi:hypothetical protein
MMMHSPASSCARPACGRWSGTETTEETVTELQAAHTAAQQLEVHKAASGETWAKYSDLAAQIGKFKLGGGPLVVE